MALQIWLPLDGRLDNLGVANTTISTVGSPTIVSTSKLGQAYQFPSTSGVVIEPTFIKSFGTKATVTFWMYLNNWQSQWMTIFQIGTTNSSWGAYIFGMLRDANNNRFCFPTGNGTTSNQNNISPNITWDLNKWYHIAIVYDNANTTAYVNDTMIAQGTTSYPIDWTKVQNIRVGCAIPSAYATNCIINDFRIYDEALSAKQVKEISKGLILHLPLTSYFDKNSLQYDTNIYTEADGSQWVRIFHHNNPNVNTARFSKTSDLWDKGYKLSDDAWCDIDRLCKQFTKFEFMCKQKTTSSAAETVYRWQQSISPLYATYAQIAPNKVTRITTAGYTNGGMGGLWKMNGDSTRFCIANSSASNWYGAAGAFVVYSSGIPGYPNTTITTGYLDLYIKISDYPDDKVYDTSGYCHNGNFVLTGVGRIENYTLTPRYKTACRIVNGNVSSNNTDLACINVPFALDYIDAFTVSWWQKKENSNTGGIFCTSNISVGSLPSDYTDTCLHQRDSGFDMKVQKSDGTWEVNTRIPTAGWDANANVWQHYVLTWDQANVKAYKNGVLVSTTAKPGVKAKDFDYLYIGLTGAGGVWRKIIGSFSDFRWYVTALSAVDVKELYETSMDIDSTGNISPRVLTT